MYNLQNLLKPCHLSCISYINVLFCGVGVERVKFVHSYPYTNKNSRSLGKTIETIQEEFVKRTLAASDHSS